MKQTILFFTVLISIAQIAVGKNTKPTKNVIVMIPDGTSLSVVSASRWLQTYRNQGNKLNIDPYLCGTVTTFSSNAPIGDSAPTASCYMEGTAAQAGNIGIYPVADIKNDLIKLNPDSAYQPLATVLEAMRIGLDKATGLVVTCEFPHATPAACSAHTYNRGDYSTICQQMVSQGLDVVIAGGNDYLKDDAKKQLENKGIKVILNNKQELLDTEAKKVWALFEKTDIPYDIDRDTTKIPSLAQTTRKAIELLNQNKNGFFLMVEGSKVDWAAHANDPIGMMTEFLAFDKAVGEAIAFAKKDKNTTVIILPDHGNSGFSIGKNVMKKSYTSMSINDLFETVSKFKCSADKIEQILHNTQPEGIKDTFKILTDIDLTDDELKKIIASKDYKASNYMEVTHSENLGNTITTILNNRTPFGFTTGGHTGEEVFLAIYNPNDQRPMGNIRNSEINQYLISVAGIKKTLKDLTSEIFSKHTDVFKGMDYKIINEKGKNARLEVKYDKATLTLEANASEATINGKKIDLSSVVIYIDKNNTFYLPKKLGEILRQ